MSDNLNNQNILPIVANISKAIIKSFSNLLNAEFPKDFQLLNKNSLALLTSAFFEVAIENQRQKFLDDLEFGKFDSNEFTESDDFFIARNIEREYIKNYGFMFCDLTDKEIIQLRSLPNKIRHAHITKLLYKRTLTDIYYNLLQNSFKDNEVKHLLKRKEIIDAAYKAHSERNFYLSIPVFLSQVEGIIGDYLIYFEKLDKGIVYSKGLKGKNKLALSTKTDNIFINIRQRIFGSDNQKKSISEIRDDIMHGKITNYATAKLSTELFLIILYLTALR
jgi:hypothetical protein